MSNPFSQGYIEPKTPTNYFKITEGTHLIRILTPKTEILSYFCEYVKELDSSGKETSVKKCYKDLGDGKQPGGTKRVWAALIYNHDLELVQVAEFAPKSIQNFLFTLASGKIKNDWTKFEIQITRTGQAMDTEYTCIAGDTLDFPEDLVMELEKQKTKFDLSKMETGEKPFED